MSTNPQNNQIPLPGSKRLIINADDLGYSMSVTRGIIDAHKKGIVTSSSAFANMAASEESLSTVLEEASFLGVGLHINFTLGQPVSYVPSLTDDSGEFYGLNSFYNRADSLPEDEVEQEIKAQIERFREITGKLPDHLDSHHHATYFTPELLTIMAAIASEYRLPIRRPIAGEHVKENTTNRLFDIVEEYSIKMPDHFISRFFGERNVTLGNLLNLLMDVEEGTTELMCHPGYVAEEENSSSSYTDPREQEIESLTHPSVREVLIAQQISTINFAEL